MYGNEMIDGTMEVNVNSFMGTNVDDYGLRRPIDNRNLAKMQTAGL